MDLYSSRKDSETVIWDKEFRNKLQDIWYQLLCMKFGNMDESNKQYVLKELALGFFEHFQFSPISISVNEYNFTYYSSVTVELEVTCFLVPHFLYAMVCSEHYPDLRSIFQLDITYNELLIYIYESAFSIRKHLRESEVKILQFLSNYSLKNHRMHLYMNSSVIAKYTRLEQSTVRKMIKDLMYNRVLQTVYVFNPWRMGYILKIFEYPSEFENNVRQVWDKWTILKQLQKYTYLRVIFFPSVHADDEFVTPDYVKEYHVNKMTLYNNLTQLSKDESTSFQKIPNFGLKKTDNPHVISFNDNQGTEWVHLLEQDITNADYSQMNKSYKSLKLVDRKKRLDKILKVFDYLTKHSTPQLSLEYVADTVHLNSNEISDILRFIIDENIIEQFLHLKYIGCNIRLVVFIHDVDNKPIINHPKMQIFLQDVLLTPYNITYIGNNAIVSILTLPTVWIESFLRYLNILSLEENYKIEWSQVLALRTLDRHIPYYPDIIINLFGAMLTQNQII